MNHPKVALSEIADLIRGITYKPSDICDETTTSAVACMRTKNVQEVLDESDIVWIPKELIRNSSKLLKPGDILVSSANSWNLVGKGCWVPELKYPASAGGFISILRGNPDVVDLRYLYHWFISPRTQRKLRSYSNKTTNISNLDHSRTLAIEIPLPPLEEQRRIAAILDKAMHLQKAAKKQLRTACSLLPSIFIETFGDPLSNPHGWPKSLLADIVKSGTDVTYGIVQAGEEFPGGIPYIRTGDLVDGEIDCSSLRHTNPEIANKFRRSRVEAGDIVMSIRATVGTTAVVPESLDGANLTQGTARIAPGDLVCGEYLLQYLRMPSTQFWIQRQVKGATFREITLKRLRELPVLVPAKEAQQRFTKRAQIAYSRISMATNFLEKAMTLASSLSAELLSQSREQPLDNDVDSN